MKYIILLILVVLPVSHQIWPFKHTKKKWWPTTPFPIITLPLSDFYLNTIYPAVTQNFTFPTIYTTGTGSGGGSSLPTFPTLPTTATTKAPTAPALPTFPTLPGGVTSNQILPSFPPLPPSGGGGNGNIGPGLPAFPQQIQQPIGPIGPPNQQLQCPPGLTACPFPGTSVVINLQPQLNPYTNCPCIDPRAYYGGAQQGIQVQQGFPGPIQQGYPGQIQQGFPGQG